MKKYTSLDRSARSWKVQLEEDPLGEKLAEQRRAEQYHQQRQAALAATRTQGPKR